MVKSSQVFKALFKNTPKTLDVGRETSIRNFAKDPFQKTNIRNTHGHVFPLRSKLVYYPWVPLVFLF